MLGLGAVPSDANGSVEVRLPISYYLRQLAATNDGYVNFIAIAWSGSVSKEFYFSKRVDGDAWISGNAPEPPSLVNLDPAQSSSTRATQHGPMASIGLPGNTRVLKPSQLRVLSRSGMGRLGKPACVAYVDDTWTGYTAYGEIHTAGDMSGVLRYGTSADSDVGVGVMSGGSWDLQGTVHVGNSRSSAIGPSRGPDWSHRVLTEMYYEKWHAWCVDGGDEQITAEQWIGGWDNGSDVSSYDHQCDATYSAYRTNFVGPGTWDRTSSHFVTLFGAAVPFGLISVTAESGASTHVDLTITFTQGVNQTRVLCGNDDYISSAHRVFAGT